MLVDGQPSSVRKSWKLRWSLELRSRRTRFLPSSSRIFRVISALSRHLASQVLQVQPALFVDSFNTLDVGRGQVESLAIELALDARPHMLEDRHQRRASGRDSRGSSLVWPSKPNVNVVDQINYFAYFS